MKISTRKSGQTIILDLEGKIDLQTSPVFRKALFEALSVEPIVIVNFQRVQYVDSSGIASMAEGYQHAKKLEKRILLFGLVSMVRNVLDLTHLSKIFEIFETEEQALHAASQTG